MTVILHPSSISWKRKTIYNVVNIGSTLSNWIITTDSGIKTESRDEYQEMSVRQ